MTTGDAVPEPVAIPPEAARRINALTGWGHAMRDLETSPGVSASELPATREDILGLAEASEAGQRPPVDLSHLTARQRDLILRSLTHSANHTYLEDEAEYLGLIRTLGLEGES